VKWVNRINTTIPLQNIQTVVDCTDFPIQDQKLPTGEMNPGLYSYKHNGPGLRYEICHGLYTGNICWINGPFHAGDFNDLKIAKECGLCDYLKHFSEQAIADSGYRGNECFVTKDSTRLTEQTRLCNTARGRQETINARIKTWGCFQTTWRHDHSFHGLAVYSVVNILQLEIDHGITKLFDIHLRLPKKPKGAQVTRAWRRACKDPPP